MKRFLHWKDLSVSSCAREHLDRRLDFALKRFAPRVLCVRTRLSDLNGPRGGVDKRCRLQAQTRSGLVQVDACANDLYAAINLAAERLQQALGRVLEREHFQNTGRWRAAGLARRRHDRQPA